MIEIAVEEGKGLVGELAGFHREIVFESQLENRFRVVLGHEVDREDFVVLFVGQNLEFAPERTDLGFGRYEGAHCHRGGHRVERRRSWVLTTEGGNRGSGSEGRS